MSPLFETIINYIPAPEGDPDAETQVLISTIDYNEYVGRIGIGKVDNGTVSGSTRSACCVNHHDPDKFKKIKIGKLYEFDGLNRVEVQEAGDRFHRGNFRYCGYPHRRYHLLPGRTRRPFPSRRFPSLRLPCISWSMTARLPDRKASSSPPAICVTVCSAS